MSRWQNLRSSQENLGAAQGHPGAFGSTQQAITAPAIRLRVINPKENAMKNKLLMATAAVAVLMLPVAAHAQAVSGAIVGGVLGGPIGAVVGSAIGAVNVGLLSDYVSKNTYPVYVYSGDVAIGSVLPTGTTYYQVPYEYMAPAYYAVVNGHTVLVDPSTRKVIQIVR
jgi:hypothetical protein